MRGSKDHPTPGRRGAQRPAPPSPVAQARLRDAMAERGAAYRTRSEIDLTLVDALLQLGKPETAAQALEDHTRVLRAYLTEIEDVLARATAEREAEHVLADAQARLSHLDPGAVAEPSRRRRSLVGAFAAAALALAGLIPGAVVGVGRPSDPAPAAAFHHARAELEAARAFLESAEASASAPVVVARSRELHDRILALPQDALTHPTVREEVGALLDDEHDRLQDLLGVVPAAQGLLLEVLALRTSLGISAPAPGPIVPTPPVGAGVPDGTPQDAPPTAPPAPEVDASLQPDAAAGPAGAAGRDDVDNR